ncbi:MAG: endonuclease MutS2 [Acholeplasmatales bacterium]|nr:endonuclease MutS2 [Acholeplasmatales bacterium]
MNYDYKVLEFDKILDILKTYTKTNYAKDKITIDLIGKSYDEIHTLVSETKEAYNALVKYGDIPLGGLTSVNEVLSRCNAGGILSPSELLQIVGLIDAATNTIKYFKSLDGIKLDTFNLKKYAEKLVIQTKLKTSISMSINDQGEVVDNASRDLFVIRKSIRSLENRLRSKMNELLLTHSKMLSDNIIVLRDNRMCLAVKAEYKNSFKGIVHDVSSSSTTAYIEPEACLSISNEIDIFTAKERKEIENILKSLSLLCQSEIEDLKTNMENLTALDIIYAKALYGKDKDYNDAIIVETQEFRLANACHPLIPKDVCVPINIELKNKDQAIIITGPNTGGKTVAMKTTGLVHLMAYYGMMVPVGGEMKIGYFDSIYADIGDEQSIEQSLSTFSSHMKKIVNITKHASDKSLIILDELGSGTDPKEGSVLAISIIEYLRKRGSKLIVTTHYSELKNYAYNDELIRNAAVEFDINTLKPTYRLIMGISGKSNALLIASRLGLSDEITDNAKERIDLKNNESAKLIDNLEEEMNKIKEMQISLENQIKENQQIKADLVKSKMDLEKNTDNIVNKAKLEAKEIIKNAQAESYKLIEEIKNMSEENFKEHELAALKNKVSSIDVPEEENKDNSKLNVGDYVFVKPYEKYGTINKVKGDKYQVNIGQFAMDFTRSELRLSAKPVEKPEKKTKLSGYNPGVGNVKLSLDLRGKRYEEVAYLMEQYLDQALYANLGSVQIIHGFGSGTIRKAVWDFLKTCTYVKSYRYGGEGEGLNGATIVYLK